MNYKHSFGFSPKYIEEVTPKISTRAYIEIAKKAYEKLDWELIYENDSELNGLRCNDFGSVKEKISISVTDAKKIKIQSKSENGIWDMGNNHKRVKTFIETFDSILDSITEEEIKQIEEKAIAKDNWDDYVIPEKLTPPLKYKEPFIPSLIIGYLLLALGLGYIISLLSLNGLYVLFLFEVLVGLILAYSLKIFLPLSGYTDFKNIKMIILGSIILLFLSNQFFQFLHFQKEYTELTFGTFISERLKQGFLLKGINIGTVGQIAIWVFQIGFSYLIAYINVLKIIIGYTIDRVPDDVINFAIYNMAKNKTESEIKIELSKKGWKNEIEHEVVFEAIGCIYGGQQINRNT
ncbi:hypothetical protein [Carboxylicivirga marina]|uniref:hypothetical protein n=1 Tax=Carboxylicivirga marina TaxID=2800988 RepID=UPI0025931A89|nr:hypothetical protein [uncultured Carboxylicivirga sp.]